MNKEQDECEKTANQIGYGCALIWFVTEKEEIYPFVIQLSVWMKWTPAECFIYMKVMNFRLLLLIKQDKKWRKYRQKWKDWTNLILMENFLRLICYRRSRRASTSFFEHLFCFSSLSRSVVCIQLKDKASLWLLAGLAAVKDGYKNAPSCTRYTHVPQYSIQLYQYINYIGLE